MKKYWFFIYRNAFSIACLLFAVFYLIINFTSVKQAILFLSWIFLLYYSAIFFNGFFKKLLFERNTISATIRYYWTNIALLFLSTFLIYFFSNWELLNAILLGVSIFAFLFAAYYFLKSRHIK
jgi:hypothetical protein